MLNKQQSKVSNPQRLDIHSLMVNNVYYDEVLQRGQLPIMNNKPVKNDVSRDFGNNTNYKGEKYLKTVEDEEEKPSEETVNEPESRYECAICMNWLNEPVLTACGHRFCKKCLNAWLEHERQWCPMDNKRISGEQDIFPDNYTRREIEQIKLRCPNAKLGCSMIASPIEVEQHRYNCPHRGDEMNFNEEKCPFSSIKCNFVGRSATNALEVHLKEDMALHLQLMLNAYQQNAVATWNPQKPNQEVSEKPLSSLPTSLQTISEEERLIQAMYQRIVILEQRYCEQNVKIENLTKQLSTMNQPLDSRYTHGTIVWEIDGFHKLVDLMQSNVNHIIYSRECFTTPYGYKFCARLNTLPKNTQMLSLHVHLMQSENDYHLDWPFNGRIRLCMVHPHDMKLSQYDTVMTKPEILAFHRPYERISTRGFGFADYANINDIIRKGFCYNDRLVIKIHMNIV